MCGIVGYVGPKNNTKLGIKALKRLEYRGYDSAGMTVLEDGELSSVKVSGKVDKLKEALKDTNFKGTPTLFHSRWSTHGGPTKENAHPQFDCDKKIAVVHNGIIENYKPIKKKLVAEGHEFTSETDTEVIAHLIEKFYDGNLESAVRKALSLVEGAYGLAVISSEEPGKIVAARMSSPVVISVNESGGFVSSDPAAIVEHSKKMVFLEDGELAVVTQDGFEVTDQNENILDKESVEIDWDLEEAQKSGHPHFMMKEMLEQPKSIKNSIRGRIIEDEGNVKLGGLEDHEEELKKLDKLTILACGTSYFASMVGKYLIEEISELPVEVALASEFRYRKRPYSKNEGFLFVSQSGETADTLKALEEVKKRDVLTLGIVNVVGSSIARETDAGIYNHAGPEIGVASTKAFTSQLAVLTLLAVYLGRQRNLSVTEGKQILSELSNIPRKVEEILEERKNIKKKAKKYKDFEHFLFMGRRYNYPTAMEGALKLKEISYIHAEGYSAAEMKHGPIALIDDDFPTFAICLQDSVYDKMFSNVEEIRARKGPVIALGTKGDDELEEFTDNAIYIPEIIEELSPILAVVPLQLLAYYTAVFKGFDPDKPRNLSKVVTVE
ncbi:MAG: glutamine--fructose-6-phosphate transaminase (isomerizing) [Patescibacteria group bacterium]